MSGCVIMVTNIPMTMTEDFVSAIFKIYGEIQALHIDNASDDVLPSAENNKKYCLIIFGSKTAAQTAMKELDEVPPLLFKISPYPPSTTRDLGSKDSASVKLPVTHVQTSSNEPVYKFPGNAIYIHKDVPEPFLQEGCCYAVYTIEEFISPHQFSLRLKISDACEAIIKQEMNQLPATRPDGWKAGPGDLIAVRFEDSWRRGIVIERTDVIVVYLLDFGKKINCTDKDVGLISSEITKYPVCAIQVSLAGVVPAGNAPSWTQAANNISRIFIDNDDIKIKIVGRHESGRIFVDVMDKVGDLKTKLVLAKLASPQQDIYHKFSHPVEKYEKFVTIPKEELAQEKVDENDLCQVLELESMEKVYIMKNDKVNMFENITSKLIDSNEQLKLPRPGFICVAFENELGFRVKVLAGVDSDKDSFKVHFLDQGFTKVVSKKDMYVLKGNLKDHPPLVDMAALKCSVPEAKHDGEVLNALRYSLVDDTKAFKLKVINGELVLLDRENNEDVVERIVKRILGNRKNEGSVLALELNKINESVNASLKVESPRTSMLSRLSNRNNAQSASSCGTSIVVEASAPATVKEEIEVASVKRVKVGAVAAPVSCSGDGAVPIKAAGEDAAVPIKAAGGDVVPVKGTIAVAETPVKENPVTRPRALISDLMKSNNKPAGEATKEPVSVTTQSGNDLKKSVRFVEGEGKSTAIIEEPVKAIIPEPFIGTVMHVESTEKFYVHRVSNDALFNEIISQIQDSVEPVNNIKVGTICGVKVNDADLIYRGRIEKINNTGTKVKISLIDEGVLQVAERKDLVQLCKGKYDYEELPGLVKLYSLTGKTWSKETNDFFKKLVDDMKQFTVKPVKVVDGLIKVDLEDKNGSVIEVLEIKESSTTNNVEVEKSVKAQENTVKVTSPPKVIEKVEVVKEEKVVVPKELPKPFKCNVTWINALKDFYVCNIEMSKVDFLEIVENIMGEVESGVSTPLASVKVGDVCIVEEEGLWFRGIVKKLAGDSVEVTSMDEGRSIKTKVHSLQTLTKFQDLPAQAIQVGLADAKDQSPDVLEIFKQVISIDESILFLAEPKRFEGDVLMIDLIDIQDPDVKRNVLEYLEE